MTNLTATPGNDAVPQLEVTTPLLGGAGGPLNAQAQALLNRIELVKLFLQQGTGAVQNTVTGKLAERVTPQDFMTDAQRMDVYLRLGILDVSDAIQKALDYLNLLGGGELFFPHGYYRKADTAPTINVYPNIRVCGAGDASKIFHDDRAANARKDLFNCDNTSNIAFENICITGTALTELNETNQSQTFTGSFVDGLRMVNVTIEKVRYMATAFNNAKNVVVTGCRLDYVVRDGLRFTNSYNVTIIGNTLRRVCDDSIALHALDAFNPAGSGFVVADNVFEQCQGIKVLGAKALTITGNVMRRMLRTPITVEFPNSGSEGNTAQFAIRISGNTVLDTFGSRGDNFSIQVYSAARSKGALAVQPGVNAAPYDYNYTNDLDAATNVKVGQYAIEIRNNIVGRTLPLTAAYSNYGYGLMFDRITTGFFSDPAIVDADFQAHGISLSGPTKSAIVAGNQVFGMGTGFNALWFQGSSGNLVDLDSLLVESNIITDCPGIGISFNFTGSSARNIVVRNNVLDLDPNFRAASHNADNTWSSSGSVIGIRNGTTVKGMIVEGNVFKNCGNTVDNITDLISMGRNWVFADVNAEGDSALNKGVRFCSVNVGFVYPIIDADPTSATYMQVTTMPRMNSTSIPTAGKYVKGHRVNKPTPTVAGSASSQYTVTGWWRATIGSGHMAGTDWIEQRMLTGT